MQPPTDRVFNKDIALLMELQRVETISNNFAIEGRHTERLRTLKRWQGILVGVLTTQEQKHIDSLINKVGPHRFQGQDKYDVAALDELHDYLNLMNTTHKLQLNVRADMASATES